MDYQSKAGSGRLYVPSLAWLLACCFVVGTSCAADDVRFNRDVRPILADKCFRCHGPDAAARQAGIRLDKRQDATTVRDGHRVIAPGEPAGSELMRRVTSRDADERMPPHDSGLTLTPRDIDVLRRWIEQGAKYQAHWSFIPPRRSSPPDVVNGAWPRNAIDRFVLVRLEHEGLQPSRQASPQTLIRRVTLDLTGLPPTLGEIDAFERDAIHNPDSAFQNVVDRLLASPRYGERMAVGWLDAARYADTNGYFTDNDRTMWRWRDWVIDAFNANMPFDQFTIEQLAGDLLPNATIDQKIATGFNRNHTVNNETGIIEEEFRVEYVVDRVDTTSTVWMGLTLGCARCHDHKYDPISQKDFYRFFAFFNNLPERGLSGSQGNSSPFLRTPTAAQQTQLDRSRRAVADSERKFAAIKKQLDDAQLQWESTALADLPAAALKGLVGHYTLDEVAADTRIGNVSIVDGMLGNAIKLNGDACVRIEDSVDFDRNDAFSFGAWIQPTSAGCVLSKMDGENEMRGFDVTLRKGKAVVNLVHRWNRQAIRVETESAVSSRQWQHLMVTYDGSSKATGLHIYFDGQPQPVVIARDSLTGTIRNDQPLRFGRRQASASYKGLIDDVRFYGRQLSDRDVYRLATRQLVRAIVGRPSAKRSAAEKRKLRAYFMREFADPKLATASAALATLRRQYTQLSNSIPTTMIMQESQKPRPAFVLIRGQYDQRGERVTAGLPAFLNRRERPTSNDGAVESAPNGEHPANRLDLANWLVHPSHPLTARVTVNRLWRQLFGIGIVKTVDDFGTQGDWPSHPELLDWLALELIESGWDMKHLLRLIVTSATYRQSSNSTPQLHHLDPENRMLARGPRFRMDAEMLRDNALAISGLLVEKLGGPSVRPYQPAGLWKDVTYDSNMAYREDSGPSLYRRGVYTFWKRQSPPPSMLVFDAPTRETCTVGRSPTNTPLQALALMNDPTFVEAARKLAERIMLENVDDESDRIVFAFRAATARRPAADEVAILLEVVRRHKDVYAKTTVDALKLLNVGASTRNESLDVADLAAWTTVASMILSLDETIVRR